jgi:hypothetical protein
MSTPLRGRPPVSPTEPAQQVTVRLTTSQREKLARLGGARWVREQLDHATFRGMK